MTFKNVSDVQERLQDGGYITSKEIATVVFLAAATKKPILVEGPAGVGKTELAKAVSRAFDCELIRLQCYEGLDEAKVFMIGNMPSLFVITQMVKERSATWCRGKTLSDAVDISPIRRCLFY